MSRVVDVSYRGYAGRRHASRSRRSAEMVPIAPLPPVRRRLHVAADRSRRLPFMPGVPVPVIRLRGVRYEIARSPVISRGWMRGSRHSVERYPCRFW